MKCVYNVKMANDWLKAIGEILFYLNEVLCDH